MAEMINVMWLPFLACVVLIGIHAYFGIHVLKREVIFVDLALAQIAALGATVAFLFHIDPQSTQAYFFSLGFITVAAAIFALTRTREQKVSQEAIIGIVYAVAAAAAILVADRSPHGAEHIKEMLTGQILWVSKGTVALDAVVYALIGLFHFACARQFMAISEGVAAAVDKGIRVRLWDFFFYASFGIVVSLSVRVAGVLLVFCFLIVPAV
ncbi:MAG: metal ABC transporter permease, partial [Planctomycetes bacterium]|nr:metal ABC transporter permease [Planctomycetota bacterium]